MMNSILKCLRPFSQISESQINLMKKGLPKKKIINNVNKIVLISSAKGGVGKSTVAANLAISLIGVTPNKSVGLLDADVFGPSQPQLFDLCNIKPEIDGNYQIIPLINYGVKVMSMGFLMNSNSALVWRGLMVMSAIEKLLFQINWDQIDCLIIDLPPGTGDVQLSICQRLFIDGTVLVTTPQKLSIIDVQRGFQMFQKMEIPVLGYVSNMSYFVCPNCHKKHEVFGTSQSLNVFANQMPMLAELPIENRTGIQNDKGLPISICDSSSTLKEQYLKLAEDIWMKINSK